MSDRPKRQRKLADEGEGEEEEEEEEEEEGDDGEEEEESSSEEEDDFEAAIPAKVGPLVVVAAEAEVVVALPNQPPSPPATIPAAIAVEAQEHASAPTTTTAQYTAPPPPPAFLSNMKQIPLPAGNAVNLVGKFIIDQNRPINMPQIVQRLKDQLTKNQVEKAVFALTQANIVLTLEDSKQPVFWVNQTMVEECNNAGGSFDVKAINSWYETNAGELTKREQVRQQLEAEVKELLMAPTDEELDAKLAEEMALIAKLKPRVAECEAILAEAERLGQSAADLQAGLVAESKKELLFYRNEWRKRKAHLMEFVERVCESKGGGGLRGAAKRELIETMGVETDESVNAKWLRGTDLA